MTELSMNQQLAHIAKALDGLRQALAPKQEIPVSQAGDYAVRTLKSILAEPQPDRMMYRLSLFADELSQIQSVLKQAEGIEDLESQRIRVTVFEEAGLTEKPHVATEMSPLAAQPALGASAVHMRAGGLEKTLTELRDALASLAPSGAASAEKAGEEDDKTKSSEEDDAEKSKAKDREQQKSDEQQPEKNTADVTKAESGWMLDMNQTLSESVSKGHKSEDWGADPEALSRTA